jgi:uncharacterized repeat protein (TIGR01451 family)
VGGEALHRVGQALRLPILLVVGLACAISLGGGALATSVIAASADLSVTKTDSPDPVMAADNITYTITVTTNGPSDAEDVVFTDSPPANTGHAGFSHDSGPAPTACALVSAGSPGAPACSFDMFPAGATVTFTLVGCGKSRRGETDLYGIATNSLAPCPRPSGRLHNGS